MMKNAKVITTGNVPNAAIFHLKRILDSDSALSGNVIPERPREAVISIRQRAVRDNVTKKTAAAVHAKNHSRIIFTNFFNFNQKFFFS